MNFRDSAFIRMCLVISSFVAPLCKLKFELSKRSAKSDTHTNNRKSINRREFRNDFIREIL